MTIDGAMQTPDGPVYVAWQRYWYRVRVGEPVYEPMSIAAVGQLLAEVAVDRVDLVAVPNPEA